MDSEREMWMNLVVIFYSSGNLTQQHFGFE